METPSARPDIRTPEAGGTFRIFVPLLVIGLVAGAYAGFYFYRSATAKPTTSPPQQRDLAEEARADLEKRSFRPLSEPLQALLTDPNYQPVPTQTHSLLLKSAPDFTLPATDGQEWSLAKRLKDGPVVLVFYFGYHCNHCVSQLFALDKDLAKFQELGAQVVAISADAPEMTRERFKRYGAFGFPVLSDAGNKVAEKYETFFPNPKGDLESDLLHGTFVINRQGKIVWANRGEGPFIENRTLLIELSRLPK